MTIKGILQFGLLLLLGAGILLYVMTNLPDTSTAEGLPGLGDIDFGWVAATGFGLILFLVLVNQFTKGNKWVVIPLSILAVIVFFVGFFSFTLSWEPTREITEDAAAVIGISGIGDEDTPPAPRVIDALCRDSTTGRTLLDCEVFEVTGAQKVTRVAKTDLCLGYFPQESVTLTEMGSNQYQFQSIDGELKRFAVYSMAIGETVNGSTCG
jgi:hypothetical protein